MRIHQEGHLEIENNLIENAIRPIALGRKNYLFAGSHKAARRAATIYSFFGMCKYNNLNPHNWLKETLAKISDTKISDLAPSFQLEFKKHFAPQIKSDVLRRRDT